MMRQHGIAGNLWTHRSSQSQNSWTLERSERIGRALARIVQYGNLHFRGVQNCTFIREGAGAGRRFLREWIGDHTTTKSANLHIFVQF